MLGKTILLWRVCILRKGDNMPVQLRPNLKLAKVVWKVLGTPKDLQQKNQAEPTQRQAQSWRASSSTSR